MRAWYEIQQPFFGSNIAESEAQYAALQGVYFAEPGIYGGLNYTAPKIINGYFGLNLIKGDVNAFLNKLISISNKLNVNPNWLLVTMWKESTLQAKALNEGTNAVGLIQFMPSTLKQWNLTWQQVYNMTALQQLDLVYKYFLPYKKYIKNYPDLYLAAFLPLAFTKSDTWPFEVPGKASATAVRNANKGIDVNKDGVITKIDFYKYVYNGLNNLALELVKSNSNNTGVEIVAKPTYYVFGTLATLLAVVGYNTLKKGK